MFQDYLGAYKLDKISSSETYELCMNLAACRLILAEKGKLGPSLKIWLNVSQDDVTFALDFNKK